MKKRFTMLALALSAPLMIQAPTVAAEI